MQMDIQSQGFTLTDSLHDYFMKRLAYALNHGDEYISRVTVRLSDINGPRASRTLARHLARQRGFAPGKAESAG